jgi:hypothetical protein
MKEDRTHAINSKYCQELSNLLERAPCQFNEDESHNKIASNSSLVHAMSNMLSSSSEPSPINKTQTEEDKKLSAQLGIKLIEEGSESQKEEYVNPKCGDPDLSQIEKTGCITENLML